MSLSFLLPGIQHYDKGHFVVFILIPNLTGYNRDFQNIKEFFDLTFRETTWNYLLENSI